jgi:hypothetical protein
MKALSIRQPWLFAILFLNKRIENRVWHPPRQLIGQRILLHASKGCTQQEVVDALGFMLSAGLVTQETWDLHWPGIDKVPRGGIVMTARLVACVTHHPSKWFVGPYGFVLEDVFATPFVSHPGSLGFFEVPQAVVEKAMGELSG